MSLRINQNIAAMNAYRNLSVTDGQMSKSLEKLSSGFRINRAADDAAGLAISEGLRSQVGGLKVAVRNAQDGISVVQTAEGALTETHSILQRMRDLAVQAANGGANDSDSQTAARRHGVRRSCSTELTRIAGKTKFNGVQRCSTARSTPDFQVGANAGDRCRSRSTSVPAARASRCRPGRRIGQPAAPTPPPATHDRQRCVDRRSTPRSTTVSTSRATLGAMQNRFEHTDQQPQRRGREPVRVREPHPGHRHGLRDGELHPLADPVPGRHRDAGAGEPGVAGRPPPPPVMKLG